MVFQYTLVCVVQIYATVNHNHVYYTIITNFYFYQQVQEYLLLSNSAADGDDDNIDDTNTTELVCLFIDNFCECASFEQKLIECAATRNDDNDTQVHLMSNMNKMCWHWPFFHTTGSQATERARGERKNDDLKLNVYWKSSHESRE